jgi:hypothetical protein
MVFISEMQNSSFQTYFWRTQIQKVGRLRVSLATDVGVEVPLLSSPVPPGLLLGALDLQDLWLGTASARRVQGAVVGLVWVVFKTQGNGRKV